MEAVVNSAKLYVGNLSYETSEASIRTAFEAHGEVASVNLITDRDSGRPKGFGFVEMGTAEEAQKAKGALDGTQMDGRALKVDVAKEQAPKAPRSSSGGYGGGGYGGGGGGRSGGGGGYGGGGGGGQRRW
jgi:cold-inducible RNA-binding protein